MRGGITPVSADFRSNAFSYRTCPFIALSAYVKKC